GEWISERTPAPVADRAIDVLGHADKPLLVAAILVVLLLLGAGLGALWLRHAPLAVLGFAVLRAVGVEAMRARHGPSLVQAAPPVVAALVAILVLHALSRHVATRSASRGDPTSTASGGAASGGTASGGAASGGTASGGT